MAAIPKFVEVDHEAEYRATPNRRETSRYQVAAQVKVTNGAGSNVTMSVEDISSHGCSIRGEVQWLRLGMILSIVLEDEPAVQAIIRWVRDGRAGMEFFRPITAAQTGWQALMPD